VDNESVLTDDCLGGYRGRGSKIRMRLIPLYCLWAIQMSLLHLRKKALEGIGALPVALETLS
jgi:hypothetical protein